MCRSYARFTSESPLRIRMGRNEAEVKPERLLALTKLASLPDLSSQDLAVGDFDHSHLSPSVSVHLIGRTGTRENAVRSSGKPSSAV
jgi:hypothetical protein